MNQINSTPDFQQSLVGYIDFLAGTSIAYTAGVCQLPKYCRGIQTTIAITLKVHLVGSPAGSYFSIVVPTNVWLGIFIFDQIIETGTTVSDYSKVFLLF